MHHKPSLATTLAPSKLMLSYHCIRTELATTLKRQATALLAELERDKEPIQITQHGLRSAYLIDVASYQQQQDRMAITEGIARGEMAVADGRVVSNDEANVGVRAPSIQSCRSACRAPRER